MRRQTHRTGMLLNSRELATLLHLPNATINFSKLERNIKKSKAAPALVEGHSLVIGMNQLQGINKQVTLGNDQRLKHTHIIGATGTGKSTLLLNMICQDIKCGEGIAVLDPHGDLIEGILSKIPLNRLEDVIIIDPADTNYPIGFNILKAHSDVEKEVLSSDLVASFKRLSTSWGDQMNSVFANAILAFLESSKGGTLSDLRKFLIEKSYREEFLKTVSDSNIIYYWQKEYPLLRTNSTGPICIRLDGFLRPRLIRNMIMLPKGIDFEKILNTRKILLVKLSQGLIGTENSFLLGTLIVSKIHQAALARQSHTTRNNFFLYIDEFQNFITPSMSHILAGARKYHLGLILAHQDLHQLQKYDSELLNTLISNAGTRICFRVGDNDARKLAEGFSSFESHDLQNLHTGEAIVRIERPEYDFSLTTDPFEPSDNNYADKSEVINYSRRMYSSSREDVELLLSESINNYEVDQTARSKSIVPSSKIAPSPTRIVYSEETKVNPEVTTIVEAKKKDETQHRYLQNLIKKMAESKGYRAIIEKPTPDGKGSVDVSIEGHQQKIACEVSVTTDSSWEKHNIAKCLSAGYKSVFVCCVDVKAVDKINNKIAGFSDYMSSSHIKAGTADMLFEWLDQFMLEDPSNEELMKGYRVSVRYDAMSQKEMDKKRESIARLVMEGVKRGKK